ncbi:helix-turn-helix domain-containing protein [Mycobacteroides abscessus]|uniref:helix-turn-helix domain-containing protein n=1 Tax=Mycobacteroides abscessus TaxID=36809 RepID=UPI000C268DB5|nr:helix-turn-helix domain-containing protein [Mycobacteroides abscessus]
MNYLKEINAFYDRLETNPLSTSAIALWYALMHINNKAGWVEWFAVAASVLSVKSGLSDRTITNARNELKVKGYIDFKSRKGNQAPIYTLVSLSEINADNVSYKETKPILSANVSDNTSGSVSDNTSGSVSDNTSTLNKLNKTETKLKEDIYILPDADAQQEFLNLINTLSIKCRGISDLEDITSYLGVVEKDLIIKALKRSEKKSVPYAIQVLENWKKDNIISLADLEAKKESSQVSGKVIPYSSRTKPDKVPDYVLNQGKADHKPPSQHIDPQRQKETDRLMVELNEMDVETFQQKWGEHPKLGVEHMVDEGTKQPYEQLTIACERRDC